MLPKMRMMCAMEHREADRVPIGEIGADWEIVEQAIGHSTYYRSKWREYSALWEGKRDQIVESYKNDIVAAAQAFEWDFVCVPTVPSSKARKKPEILGPYTWREDTGHVWTYSPKSGGHEMLVKAPSMAIEDIQIPEPFPVDESRLEAVAHAVRTAGGTHYIVGRLPSSSFPWRETVGLEEFLTRMVTDPPFVHRAIAYYRKQLVAYGSAMLDLGVDAILEGSDYCDNRGALMGPQRFREFILPAMQDLGRLAHARGKHFIKHTDGNCWSVLDDFVAAGAHAWQGIQPRIGMDLRLLKERYAGRLCLMGGVNCETLTMGRPDQVVAEVQYAIRHAAPGGGLVLTSGNTLQLGTRWDNYAAMRTAARQYGAYPIRVD